MAEYQHIANLRGPQGEPGIAPDEIEDIEDSILNRFPLRINNREMGEVANLDDRSGIRDFGSGRIFPNQVEGVPEELKDETSGYTYTHYGTGAQSASVQLLVGRLGFFYRESTGSVDFVTQWGEWKKVNTRYKDDILTEARAAGWHAVFDPTDKSTITMSGNRVTEIRDGLGNLPPLSQDERTDGTYNDPWLYTNEMGDFDAVGGLNNHRTLASDFPEIEPPYTIIALGGLRTIHARDQNQYMFNGVGSSGARIRAQNGYWFGDSFGGNTDFRVRADRKPHVFCLQMDETSSLFTVDGELAGRGDLGQRGIRGLRIGASFSTPDDSNEVYWRGNIGPILIYKGRISSWTLRRMLRLIHSKSGISISDPNYPINPNGLGVRVYSKNEYGEVTVQHGDVNAVSPDGIQSVTKCMTTWTALQYARTEPTLDETHEILERDIMNGNRLQVGDVVSLRDLLYIMWLPSDNTAPEAVARIVGQMIKDDEGDSSDLDPKVRFKREMEDRTRQWGMTGTFFPRAHSRAQMSTRQMAEMFERVIEDPLVFEIGSTLHYDVTISGPNARNYTVDHSMVSQGTDSNWLISKGGTGHGWSHHVRQWIDDEGVKHVTAVTDGVQGSLMTGDSVIKARLAIEGRTTNPQPVPQSASLSPGTSIDLEEYVPEVDFSAGSARLNIRRTNHAIQLSIVALRCPEDWVGVGVVPEAFAPSELTYAPVSVNDGQSWLQGRVTTSGNIEITGNSVDDTLRATFVWPI